MKKLKNKVFYTIFGILTISLLSFIIIFNIQNYFDKKNIVERSLNMNFIDDKKGDMLPPRINDDTNIKLDDKHKIDYNIRFMDATIYTVVLDSNDNIIDIINHSNTDIDNIKEIASSILNNKNIKRKYIGFLYLDNYSYSYSKGNSLIILDNTNIKEDLLDYLRVSLIILIVLEVIIIYISKKITNWIIKPVEESFNKQKEFIADASHELKTPLSVIVASADALEANPNEKKWLSNIKTESERMNNLIKDLLDMASSEKENITMTEANLSKAVELSLLTFEGRAYEKNIKLEYEIDSNISFKMNENSIRQLVEILLDNAIKHTKEKGKVSLYLKNSSNIELLVINEGEPIPKGEEEKIFERFYRVDKARNRNDNRYGLGLAIAKNIVENHRGTIKAFSNNGTTTFKVIFKK